MSASNTAGRALANSEVKSKLSLPTERKSCWGGGMGRGGVSRPFPMGGGSQRHTHAGRRLEKAGAQLGRGQAASSSTPTGQSHGQDRAHGHRMEGRGCQGRRWQGGRAQQTRLSLRRGLTCRREGGRQKQGLCFDLTVGICQSLFPDSGSRSADGWAQPSHPTHLLSLWQVSLQGK